MDIIAGIGAATEGLKLIGELRRIDKEVDKAELKLRLVDLADKLLDAKQALQDAQEERRVLLEKITRLENDQQFKKRLQDEKGRLYVLNDDGVREGEPYCDLCYVKENKLFRMIRYKGNEYGAACYWCNNCRKSYYD
jgi:hypothetical protein